MNKTLDSVNRQLIDEYPYPLRDPLYIVIPLTVIYSVIFLTGVLGNVITCIVISRNKSMHTATNYYLFSLAVSDLLLLVSGLPQEMYNMWYNYPYPFNEAVCVCQGFAAETSANATVLTITAFTIERYMAICHPFLSHTMSKLSRAVKLILAIWVLAMCLAIPQTLDLGITHRICTIKRALNPHIFAVSTVLVFVFPMAVITILYILIGLQLRKSKVVKRGTVSGSSVRLKHNMFKRPSHRAVVTVNQSPIPQKQPYQLQLNKTQQQQSQNGNHFSTFPQQQNLSEQKQQQQLNSPEDGRINYSTRAQNHGTRHVVNMLVAVVVAFFICWAPFHAQRLFAMYLEEEKKNDHIVEIYMYLTHVSGVLYFTSTCINPFLYNIMSYKFREAFKDTLARYLYRRHGRQSMRQGRFHRTMSQRSYSNNSQSANTCSSICSTQFYNQTHSTRCTDGDLLATPFQSLKRPLVVSFRRIPQTNNSNNNSINNSLDNSSLKNYNFNNEINRCKFSDTEIFNSKSSFCYHHNHRKKKNFKLFDKKNYDKENVSSTSFEDESSSISDNLYIDKFCTQHEKRTQFLSKCRRNKKKERCFKKINIINNIQKVEIVSATTKNDYRFDDFDGIASGGCYSGGTSSTSSSFRRGIEKSPSESNLYNENFVSCIFYPINETQRFDITKPSFSREIHNYQNQSTSKPIRVLNQIKNVNCKSPYESPELSINSKKLEENLRTILEDLVLYPRNQQNQNNNSFQNKCSKILSRKNQMENGKCRSMPSINCSEIYNYQKFNRIDKKFELDKNFPKKFSYEIFNMQQQNERHLADDVKINYDDNKETENFLEKNYLLRENCVQNLEHPLDVLIKESENSFQ